MTLLNPFDLPDAVLEMQVSSKRNVATALGEKLTFQVLYASKDDTK